MTYYHQPSWSHYAQCLMDVQHTSSLNWADALGSASQMSMILFSNVIWLEIKSFAGGDLLPPAKFISVCASGAFIVAACGIYILLCTWNQKFTHCMVIPPNNALIIANVGPLKACCGDTILMCWWYVARDFWWIMVIYDHCSIAMVCNLCDLNNQN